MKNRSQFIKQAQGAGFAIAGAALVGALAFPPSPSEETPGVAEESLCVIVPPDSEMYKAIHRFSNSSGGILIEFTRGSEGNTGGVSFGPALKDKNQPNLTQSPSCTPITFVGQRPVDKKLAKLFKENPFPTIATVQAILRKE